jgi:hypothetical protein
MIQNYDLPEFRKTERRKREIKSRDTKNFENTHKQRKSKWKE